MLYNLSMLFLPIIAQIGSEQSNNAKDDQFFLRFYKTVLRYFNLIALPVFNVTLECNLRASNFVTRTRIHRDTRINVPFIFLV